MNVIEPSFKILDELDGEAVLRKLEAAGRTCYKSEDKITKDSGKEFIAMIIKRGHETVLEHEKVSVRIVCDRGVSHELVRHRISSFSQESTRYVRYNDDNISFIKPYIFKYPSDEYGKWYQAMQYAEYAYSELIKMGASPQWARSVLPNSLKTEVVMTCNLREWRHIFRLRCHKTAHPQMREIMIPMLKRFQNLIPIIFDDIC